MATRQVSYVGGATIATHRKNFRMFFKDYFQMAQANHKQRVINCFIEEPEDLETKEVLTELMSDYVTEYGKQIKFHWV